MIRVEGYPEVWSVECSEAALAILVGVGSHRV